MQADIAAVQQGGEEDRIGLLVRQVTFEAEGVISIELVRGGRGALPAWEPGSHIDLILPSGLIRQYSLCGDLSDVRSYKIAVLREELSRGGSLEIHESALVGREIEVRGPRNRFALEPADRYLFIAGGIGVTPILPMIQRAEATGTPWHLVYGGRTRAHMAFVSEIESRGGGTVDLRPQDEFGILDLDAILASADRRTGIYACGPGPMLSALETRCETRGVSDALHLERFTIDLDEAVDGLAGEDDEFASFEVELTRSGRTIVVAPDRTVLESVREVASFVLSSCEDGYCGTCETRVIEGIPDHRDMYLTDEERAENHKMMICVSRSKSARLVLDL